jgi:hypothetical protein
MRTDHIERLSSACDSLSKLAEIVLAEHERQKAVIENIMKSMESVAAKTAKPGERQPSAG